MRKFCEGYPRIAAVKLDSLLCGAMAILRETGADAAARELLDMAYEEAQYLMDALEEEKELETVPQ